MREHKQICCFSGHRPEKLSASEQALLMNGLEATVRRAAGAGFTAFLTGMGRGFDLWAARTVLSLRDELGLELWCAVPYAGQEEHWPAEWRALYQEVLLSARRVYCLHTHYTPQCFHDRNRFMVENAQRLICYFNGSPGGTAYTLRLARAHGLEIENLADRQLALWD